MSINITGIAINKNYKNKEDLENDLNLKLTPNGEEIFESALGEALNEELIFVYAAKNGTLIHCGHNFSSNFAGIDEAKSLSFAISEVSMYFDCKIYNGTSLIKQIHEEDGGGDSMDEIFKEMEDMTGESFWDIEPDANVSCYKINKTTNITPNRKWWMFWK